MWRSSPSLGESAETFAGTFADGYGYGGPPIDCRDATPDCIEQFVQAAYTQAAMTAGGNSSNVLWPMGGDFSWSDASQLFDPFDKLIPAVNADGRVQTLYSTPSIYLRAKHAENLTWTVKTDDYMPYADNPDSFWTAYYTSRPALKRYVRMTSALLQVTRHMEVFTGASGDDSQTLWEAQGVAQHHDAVSGTERQVVAFDYAQRLSVGADIADQFIAQTLSQLVTQSGDAPSFSSCPLSNVSVCETTQGGGQLVVMLYNPLARHEQQLLTVPWNSSDAPVVSNAKGSAVPSQLSTVMPSIAQGPDSAPYQLQFVASLPALGFTTYFITASNETSDALSPAAVPPAPRAARSLLALPSLAAADVSISNDHWQLTFDGRTGLLSRAVDVVSQHSVAITQNFLYYNSYQSDGQDSGAYIFRPDVGNASAIPVAMAVNVSVVKGSVVSEVRQQFAPWLTQIVRLTAGSPVIELQWTVGHIPVDDQQGKEVISRFSTGIQSDGVWYTDSNGRELQRRQRNTRQGWQWNYEQVDASNYYPVNSLALLRDAKQGLAVLTDRSQGCSSLSDGSLELMVHRRTLQDDGRGVGEPINEPGDDGLGLTVTGSHYLILAPPERLNLAARYFAAKVFAPAYALYAELTESVPDYLSGHEVSRSFLRRELPVSVDLMTLQVHDAEGGVALLRLAHQFGLDEDEQLSKPVTLQLGSLFTRAIDTVVELTLTGNQAVDAHRPYRWRTTHSDSAQAQQRHAEWTATKVGAAPAFNVTISSAQIRTFNITFA